VKSGEKGFTLVELIISAGILAVLSIGIVGLFVKAHINNQKAMELDNAVLEINNLIERFHDTENSIVKASQFVIYYNDKWELSDNDSEIEYVIYGDIEQLSDEQEGLYSLQLKAVRLKPYPFEAEENHEIYSIDVIFEDTSLWSE